MLEQLDARSRLAYDRHLRVCARCREEVDLLMRAALAVPLLAVVPQAPEALELPRDRYGPGQVAVAHAAAQAKLEAEQAKLEAARLEPELEGAGGGSGARRPALQVVPRGPDPTELRRAAQAQRLETAALRSGFKPDAARLIADRGGWPTRNKRRLLQRPVPAPAVVGFLLVAVIAVATLALSGHEAAVRYARVKAGWTHGGAAIEYEDNQLGLVVERMPHPAHGYGYQVWVVERKTKRLVPTTAWLRLDRSGDAGVNVPGNYHDWYAAAVYVEPLHGRESTRSGAVVVADLRHVA